MNSKKQEKQEKQDSRASKQHCLAATDSLHYRVYFRLDDYHVQQQCDDQRLINGYFAPSRNDCRCQGGLREVAALAHAQEKEGLRRAANKLDNTLRQAGQAYHGVEAGAYLPRAVKY